MSPMRCTLQPRGLDFVFYMLAPAAARAIAANGESKLVHAQMAYAHVRAIQDAAATRSQLLSELCDHLADLSRFDCEAQRSEIQESRHLCEPHKSNRRERRYHWPGCRSQTCRRVGLQSVRGSDGRTHSTWEESAKLLVAHWRLYPGSRLSPIQRLGSCSGCGQREFSIRCTGRG